MSPRETAEERTSRELCSQKSSCDMDDLGYLGLFLMLVGALLGILLTNLEVKKIPDKIIEKLREEEKRKKDNGNDRTD